MDALVNLLNLPSIKELEEELRTKENIVIRRAMTPDMYRVLEFVDKNSGLSAKGEATVAFSHQPVTLYIATYYDEIVGYACYDCTFKGFFGPTRVLDKWQKKGIGKALLVKSLEGLRELGYIYAIIGFVGPMDFYKKAVGAIEIPNSTPAGYKDFLPLCKKNDDWSY